MFIVCPSCSGPYRIPAEQIAPLVQTACPHCEYRVILDFEAANEPSLREAGHQFAQGFESADAYASVYDHVTSKPDAQPRLGVTSVASFATTAATGSDTRNSSGQNRPLQQRPSSAPNAAASASVASASSASASSQAGATQPSVRSAGTKTVIQAPPKKPVSMTGEATDGPSPSLSGTGGAGGSSMRAGRGVDLIDEQKPEIDSREQEAASRTPPHTPPVASVVSSGPVAAAVPTRPEDVAAQSGQHSKPGDTANKVEPRAEIPPVKPASTSMMWIIIVALLLVGGVLLYVFVLNKP